MFQQMQTMAQKQVNYIFDDCNIFKLIMTINTPKFPFCNIDKLDVVLNIQISWYVSASSYTSLNYGCMERDFRQSFCIILPIITDLEDSKFQLSSCIMHIHIMKISFCLFRLSFFSCPFFLKLFKNRCSCSKYLKILMKFIS